MRYKRFLTGYFRSAHDISTRPGLVISEDEELLMVGQDGELTPSGGSQAVHCVLARDNPFDVRTVGDHPILWDALYDNYMDFNTLLSIPDGLGLDFVFDGTSADIETTEDGIWTFTYSLAPAGDNQWGGVLHLGMTFMTIRPGETFLVSGTFGLASGTTLPIRIQVSSQAANNPFELGNTYCIITRVG